MNFTGTISYGRPAGRSRTVLRTAAPAVGGLTEFGELQRQAVRDDIRGQAPRPSEIAAKFLEVLRSRRSEWPSTGLTANTGPYATDTSVRSFLARQGRTETGAFRPWVILNDARNARGVPYAGFVDQGIRTGGAQVSPSRYRANHRAVRRTWDANIGDILRELR